MKKLLKDQNEWLDELPAMKQRSYCYMVLDTQDLTEYDRKRLELSVNILGVCQTLATSNAMLSAMGIKKEFDFCVLYETMNAVMNSKSFTDEQLKRHHDFLKEYDGIQKALELINLEVGDIWIDPDVDLLLLGFNFDEMQKIYNWSSDKIGIDTYYDIQEDYKKGKISFNEFISQARSILNNILSEPIKTKQ